MGFYKNADGLLLWSADRVLNDEFELWIDKKDTYNYPVEGWIWADTEIQARQVLQCYGDKPFPSWILNFDKAQYEAPIAKPKDGKNYIWDEINLSWVEHLTEIPTLNQLEEQANDQSL